MGSFSYGDLFEDWEIAMAKKAVARFQAAYPWLTMPDFDDLLQECLSHWYFNRGRFRPDAGASRSTFMASVLANHLKLILRTQLADKRKASHLSRSLEEPADDDGVSLADVIPAEETASDNALNIDVRSALAGLTPLEKSICYLISQGYPVAQVAEALGKPRSTVRDCIRRIRETFSRKGLDEYFD